VTLKLTIREIQGEKLSSDYDGHKVQTQGVVTGVLRRGFFMQTPDKAWDQRGSDGIFVYTPEWIAEVGALVRVSGEVVDFYKHDSAKPVTQLHAEKIDQLRSNGAEVEPLVLSNEFLPKSLAELADRLNSLEGMLLRIPAGQTFLAPSNKYGDYVLALDSPELDESETRTESGGLIPGVGSELRWFPGFRISNSNHAKRLNLGAKLLSDIQGPLNYRADSYQLSVSQPFEAEAAFVQYSETKLVSAAGKINILTLNCFNLDPKVEREALVNNPRLDIDDDWSDGRFHTLAQAVVLQAKSPDIVALQEIQDNDGAEVTDITDASETYALLIECIRELGGPEYQWIDVAPHAGMDGGQPGGNIRNGYLYNPERVSLIEDSVEVLGRDLMCYDDSRKPLVAHFIESDSGQRLAVINVHLASKRHQASIFAPQDPGVDAKLQVRVAQADCVYQHSQQLLEKNIHFYITGDFNDTEHSDTLAAFEGDTNHNLVMDLALDERYDYNHRGKLQVLMHGLVSKDFHQQNRARYEILHGNELLGITPGEDSSKPSDHAYVIASLDMREP